MKNFFVFTLLLFAVQLKTTAQINPLEWTSKGDSSVSAQRVLFQKSDSILSSFPFDTITKELKAFNRSKSFWEGRGVNETQSSYSPQQLYSKAMTYLITDYRCYNDWMSSDFEFVGPYFDEIGQNAGMFISVWGDSGNPDFVLGGSNGGGIFKTIDGGQHWTNVTAQNNFPGVTITSIQQDLDDPNTFYASTGSFVDGAPYGIGLIVSHNSGDSWAILEEFASAPNKLVEGQVVRTFKINPYNHDQFVCTRLNRVFISNDKGQTWNENSPDYSNSAYHSDVIFTDIEFGIGNKIVLCNMMHWQSESAQAMWTDNGGNSWNLIDFSQYYGYSGNLSGNGAYMANLLPGNSSSTFSFSSNFIYDNDLVVDTPSLKENYGVLYGTIDTSLTENYIEKCRTHSCSDILIYKNKNYILGGPGNTIRDFTNFYVPKGVKFSVYFTNGVEDASLSQLAYESGYHSQGTYYSKGNTSIVLNTANDYYHSIKVVFDVDSTYSDTTYVWWDNFGFVESIDYMRRIECDLTYASNYAYFSLDDGNVTHLTESLLSNLNSSTELTQFGGHGKPGGSMMTMESNPTKRVYINGAKTFVFDITGDSLVVNGGVSGHLDNRGIFLSQKNNGHDDEIFMANDGGISYSIDGGVTWQILNGTGMNANQIHGFDVSKDQKDFIVFGQQDGPGAVFFDSTGLLNDDTDWLGGDGVRALLSDDGDFPAYGTGNEKVSQFLSPTSRAGGRSQADLYLPYPIVQDPRDNNKVLVGTHDGVELYDYNVSGNPTSDTLLFCDTLDVQKARELYWSTSDPDIIYASFNNTTFNTSIRSSHILFKSNDGGESFSDITYGLDGTDSLSLISGQSMWSNISGIAIDESNTDRVWVCYDGIGFADYNTLNYAEGIGRVYYSNDGGDTWSDVSQGLSAMPVTDIEYYQYGHEDVLFAGTDFGVFVKVGNNPWECFSNGLPMQFITELQINECAKELYAATYGRGIWKTDISMFGTKEFVVSSDRTISTDEKSYSDILIESGNTLTVEAKLSMSAGTKIIVEPGAELKIDGGVITNDCGEMWLGIDVQGDASLPQSTQNQGRVLMQNNAIIEYAKNGIRTIGTDQNDVKDWSKTGGIVRVLDGSFINCRRGIEFLDYQNFNPSTGAIVDNISYVHNCHFLTTEELPNGDYPYCGISMYKVNNVKLSGLEFVNSRVNVNDIPYSQRGSGIIALDANVTLRPGYFNGNPIPVTVNRFEDLNYGVIIAGVGGLSNSYIRENDFVGNEVAILLDGAGNTEVIRNNIEIPNYSYNGTPRQAIGIVVDHAYGYLVTENNITTDASGTSFPRANFTNNTNITSGRFYQNNITDIAYGIQLEKTNSLLEVDCNNFDRQSRSIIDIYHHDGFVADQGEAFVNGIPARNNFYNTCDPVLNSQIYQGDSKVNNWIYNGDAGTIDSTCVDPNVSVVFPATTNTNSCPSEVEDLPGGGVVLVGQLIDAIVLIKDNIETIKGELAAGDAEELITAIDNQSGGSLKDILMGASPLLSERVLKSYLAKPQQQPNGHIKQIILANSPVSDDILNQVGELNLPNGINNQILIAQNGISPREQAEAEIKSLNTEKLKLVDKVVRAYLDTNWVDTARVFLENEGSPEALCALIPMEVTKDTVKTKEHLAELRQEAVRIDLKKKGDPMVKEINDFCDFYEDVMSVSNRPGGLLNLSKDEQNILKAYIESGAAIASNARAIQDFIRETTHAYVLENPDLNKAGLYKTNESILEESSGNQSYFSIVPNPTSGNALLKLQGLGENCEGCFYVITDLSGKQVAKTSVNQTTNVSLGNLGNGVYLINLQFEDSIIETKKIVIQH